MAIGLKQWMAGVGVGMGVFLQGAQAADFPERAVRVVIPFPAGAAADSAMRVVAKKLSDQWHQPVLVDNRPGVPGIQAGAAAAPDGYTLLLGAGSSMVTSPLMVPKLAYSPSQFIPISKLVVNVPVLVAHPSAGIHSVKELVALAKQKPGKIDYSSSGTGSPGHLAMEMFQSITGTQFMQIPYKGGATAVNDLLGGQVPLGINALPSVVQHVRSGKLLALAVASNQRSAALPDVPTMAEAGVPNFEYEIWYALFAPARTPPAIAAQISTAVQQALNDPEVKRSLAQQGAVAAPTSPEELAGYLKEDTARWAKLIKERHLSLE